MPQASRQSNRRRTEAGLTLIELIITTALIVVLSLAISYAFATGVTVQRRQEANRATTDRSDDFERAMTQLIEGARLAGSGPGADATSTSTTSSASTTSSSSSSSSTTSSGTDSTDSYLLVSADAGTNDLGVDRITFTTTAPGVSIGAVNDTTDTTTSALNTARGPFGGLSEVSLGTTAIGDAAGQTGLFERLQQPSDGDPTQGGNESLLDPDIDQIGFQFWDGTEWTEQWDTTTMTTQRLPEAVQVEYRLKDDTSKTVHLFVVPIPASDVTANNPLTATDTSGTSSTTQ